MMSIDGGAIELSRWCRWEEYWQHGVSPFVVQRGNFEVRAH
jgi:hypothetical protein